MMVTKYVSVNKTWLIIPKLSLLPFISGVPLRGHKSVDPDDGSMQFSYSAVVFFSTFISIHSTADKKG